MMKLKYKNIAQDLTINYKVNTYNLIIDLFDIKDGELPSFHMMLALMGYKNRKKTSLNESDGESDKPRNFSLRTLYNRNEADMDAYYGLISILDNLELPYEEVINKIAFERTEINNTPFLKMNNVKTFYEYMLGGITYFENNFLVHGKDPYRVASLIHEFLTDDDIEVNEILLELLMEEEYNE